MAGATRAAEETPVKAGDSDTASLAVMAAPEKGSVFGAPKNAVQGFTFRNPMSSFNSVSAGDHLEGRLVEVVSPFDKVESGGPSIREVDQCQPLVSLPFSDLELVFKCPELSKYKFEHLVSEACQFQKHFLQLGVSLMQLLLSSPKEGTWIKTFIQQVQDDKKLSPARRDLLPLGCLPPVGAIHSLLPRFPSEASGMIRCDIGCLSSLGRQRRKNLIQACAMQVWRLLVILVLNGESIDWNHQKVFRQSAPTGPQNQMISRVTSLVNRFCTSPGSSCDMPDFHELVKSKTIDYNGEECGHALPLILGELKPGLPPLGVAGTLEAHAVAGPDVQRWLEDPSKALKPIAEWPLVVPQAKINATRQEWEKLCGVLFGLGIICPIDDSDIFEVNGEKVLNGAFAVPKKGAPAPGQSRVTRLIMNLVPANSYQKLMPGDLNTLASSPSWTSIVLKDNEVLLWSSDDQRGAFYAWRLPAAWRRFMAFKWRVPGSLVGLTSNAMTYVAASVIPMGWINAVSLFQHLHRQLGLQKEPFGANLPEDREWRRDRPIPISGQQQDTYWFQYYLDDFDAPEAVPAECWEQYKGTLSGVQQRQREAYARAGVSIAEGKSQCREPLVVRMGAEVDGLLGVVGMPRDKVLELLWFSLWLLRQSKPSMKALLMVLGRMVRCFEFRRPLMSLLGNCWPKVHPSVRAPLHAGMVSSIMKACVMTVMAVADLRLKVDGAVTASDASTLGGGMCISGELTEEGKTMLDFLHSPGYQLSRGAVFTAAGAMPRPLNSGPRIFVLSLFDGIAAVMCALSRLPCAVIGFAASEIDKDCRRLVRRRWPGVIELGSVTTIDGKVIDALVQSLGYKVDLVLIPAGSPCQDLSSLLSGGQGLQGKRSKLFYEIPRIVDLCKERFSCVVHFFVENVFSMTEASRKEFSAVLGVEPVLVEASYFTWCRRPRLFWASWAIVAFEGENLIDKGDYQQWTFPDLRPEAESWVDEGCFRMGSDLLPTLTRALPRNSPPKDPAGLAHASLEAKARWTEDRFRFQVYHYETHHLIQEPSGTLRTPSLPEREILMGFDPGYLSKALPPKLSVSEKFNMGACMIGNTFCVHVITMLCHSLLAAMGATLISREYKNLLKTQEAPAGWTSYPQFDQQTKPNLQSQHFVQEILRCADKAGSDVRLDVGIPFRFKAFPRAGIKASYFRWKIVHGYKWKHSAHINCLELQAVINSIQWRLRRLKGQDRRVLHLVDSQVVASVIAKGRSSSYRLRKSLCKLNALLIAGGLSLVVSYVHTTDNPSDIPSRWCEGPFNKKGGKADVGSLLNKPSSLPRSNAATTMR